MKHFDTLRYKEELEKSGMDEKSARALTKMNAEFFEEMLNNQNLSTKEDINRVERALKEDLNRIEIELSGNINNIEIKVIQLENKIGHIKDEITNTLLKRLNLYFGLIAVGIAVIGFMK